MQLDDKISELLYHYDCVIIPEFGGFVTNYKPAHLDERLHLFHPPSKEVSFNRNLKRNDGLLAHYLAEVDRCSFEEANEVIRKSVEDYFTRLNNGERVVFNKVGIIYHDNDRNLRFQPTREENFLKDAFGLDKIFAVPVVKPATQKATSDAGLPKTAITPVIPLSTEKQEKPAEKVAAMPQRPYKKWAWAAAVALPVLAYSGWLLSLTNGNRPADLTIADLNPFKGKHASFYSERNAEDAFGGFSEMPVTDETDHSLASDSGFVRVSFTDPEGEGVWVRLKESAVTPAVSTYTATPEVLAMRYHIVGGCFSELSNARKMVDGLRRKGFSAYIYDYHKGLYRVTFADFNSRKQALAELRRIQQDEMKSAWLLVR